MVGADGKQENRARKKQIPTQLKVEWAFFGYLIWGIFRHKYASIT
jgi:hypothetical protein